MSGRRTATITITEEEYRRLHDLEMKRRFERDANDVEQDYRQRLDGLNLQIKNLQGKLLAQKQEDAPDALALHQRLQIASRLIQALQQAEYRQVGYEFADQNRTTVLLRMERASDGSRVTVAVGQDPDLFWAKDTQGYFGLQGMDASGVLAAQGMANAVQLSNFVTNK